MSAAPAGTIRITRTEKHEDGSVTLYGVNDDGEEVYRRFPPGAMVERIVCGTCKAPLTGGECFSCVTPEQIGGGDQ